MNPATGYDVLIINALVVNFEPEAEPVRNAFVAVRNGIIAAIGPMDELPPVPAAETIDAAGCLVIPGLINTHVHAPMTCFRGLADDLPLMTWLQEHIFPAEAAHAGPDMAYWGAKLACAEMLLSGTTCFVDSYFHEADIARSVSETGIRAMLAQGVVDFPAPGVPDPARNIDHVREYLDEWLGRSPLVLPVVFCHSPYTCSPETLRKGKELAREKEVPFLIHLAETAAEVGQITSERGLTPARYLDSLGLLDEETICVHCVHLDQGEIELLAERSAAVSICLESNMKLASGLPPLPAMIKGGLRLSLGTDGAASNNDLNLFGEIKAAAMLYKAAGLDPTAVPAAEALYLAGPGGASVLGLGGVTGSLTPGFRADLCVLDCAAPHLMPLYNPRSHLVYAASGREIKHVLVDGRILVRDGRLLTIDLDETMARVREIAAKIK